MTTLYHASPSAIAEILDTGIFGGIFALPDEFNRGQHTYKAELESNEILDVISRVDWDVIERVIVKETLARNDDDIQSVYEMLQKDDVCDESLWSLLNSSTDYDDAAGAGFETQRLRGCIAKAAGYKAVECSDEYGTSFLLLPGTKIEAV